ncbi:MAG: TetR family transcriptional regulator [Gemmatimonadaceae bacterium]
MATLPRRTPTQRRSQERLARIVFAAGELCGERGVDGVTMDAIAERAGTSIGSLYQFFPNRDALLQALAERNVADLNMLLDGRDMPEMAALPLAEMVDSVLAPFVDFHEAHPGYFSVLFAPQGSRALRAIRGRLRTRLRRRVERLFRLRAPDLSPTKRRRIAITSVEAGRALMQYIEQNVPAAERRAQRAELRAMLVAYLEPFLGQGGSGKRVAGGGGAASTP